MKTSACPCRLHLSSYCRIAVAACRQPFSCALRGSTRRGHKPDPWRVEARRRPHHCLLCRHVKHRLNGHWSSSSSIVYTTRCGEVSRVADDSSLRPDLCKTAGDSGSSSPAHEATIEPGVAPLPSTAEPPASSSSSGTGSRRTVPPSVVVPFRRSKRTRSWPRSFSLHSVLPALP